MLEHFIFDCFLSSARGVLDLIEATDAGKADPGDSN